MPIRLSAYAAAGRYGETSPKLAQQPPASGGGPGCLRRDFDVDGPRPRIRPHRERHGEHAVLVFGRDLRGVNRLRQLERSAEGAVGALDPMELLLPSLALELALTLEGQRVVLDRYGDVFPLHVG